VRTGQPERAAPVIRSMLSPRLPSAGANDGRAVRTVYSPLFELQMTDDVELQLATQLQEAKCDPWRHVVKPEPADSRPATISAMSALKRTEAAATTYAAGLTRFSVRLTMF